MKVSRQAVYKLMKAAKGLQKGNVPKQQIGSGRKRKMLGKKDRNLKTRNACQSINLSCKFKEAPKASGGGFKPGNLRSTEKRLGPPL